MSRLLSAGLARMRKSRMFYVGIIIFILIGGLGILAQYEESKSTGFETCIDSLFFINTHIIGIFIAAFCSLFVGTEYSDGTIRNKLVVGQRRGSIYMATFVVTMITSLIVYFIYMAFICAVGIPVLGGFEVPVSTVVKYMIAGVVTDISLSAIYTLISMMIQNKTIVAIVAITGFFAMFFGAVFLSSSLGQPEIWDSSVTIDENGELVKEPPEPNPYYVDGTKREVYEFLMDFLPTGQAQQISTMSAPKYWRMMTCSAGIIIVTTACGLFFFRKKDLK